jgi:hypothetical protein
MVGRSLELVLGDLLDTVDEASTRGAIEEGLGIGRTELQVGEDVGFADPYREPLKSRRGAYGLAMTGDERSHRNLQH